MGITQKELAKKVGRSAKHVASRLHCWSCLAPYAGRSTRRLGLGAAAALLELVDEPQVIEEIAAGDPADVERAVLRHQARSAQQRGYHESDVGDPEDDLQVGREGADGEAEAAESEWQRRARAIEAEAARRKSLSEARTARGEFVLGLVQRRLPKGDVSGHVAATVVETMSAARPTGVPDAGGGATAGTFGPDYRTPLVDHAASSVEIVTGWCWRSASPGRRRRVPATRPSWDMATSNSSRRSDTSRRRATLNGQPATRSGGRAMLLDSGPLTLTCQENPDATIDDGAARNEHQETPDERRSMISPATLRHNETVDWLVSCDPLTVVLWLDPKVDTSG